MSSGYLTEVHLHLPEPDASVWLETGWCEVGGHYTEPDTLTLHEWTDGDVTCCESCRLRAAERLAERGC